MRIVEERAEQDQASADIRSTPHTKNRARELERCRDDSLGKLRHQLGMENILRHRPRDRVLRVLDLGGGNGYYAIEIAKQGGFVEMLESDNAAIETARRNIATAGLGERVRVSQADSESAICNYRSDSFNIVFCHHLIEFISDYRGLLSEVDRVLKPGGILSLIFANAYAEPLRLIQEERNPEAALTILTGGRDAEAPATLRPKLVSHALHEAQLQSIGDYGIGIFTAPDQETQKYTPEYATMMLAAEQAASMLPQYLPTARYRQIIALKVDSGKLIVDSKE